ncbi:Obp99c family protein [Megaselia abdita]
MQFPIALLIFHLVSVSLCVSTVNTKSGRCQYSYSVNSPLPYIPKTAEDYEKVVQRCLITLRGSTDDRELKIVFQYNVIPDKTMELLRCIDIGGGPLENNVFYIDRFAARSRALTGKDNFDIFKKCVDEGVLICYAVSIFKYSSSCAFAESVWQPLSPPDLKRNFDQCWISSGILDQNNMKYYYAQNFVVTPELSRFYYCVFQMNNLLVGDPDFGYHFVTYRIARQYYGNMTNPVAYLKLRQCFNEERSFMNDMQAFRVFQCLKNRMGGIQIIGQDYNLPIIGGGLGEIDVRSVNLSIVAMASNYNELVFSRL